MASDVFYVVGLFVVACVCGALGWYTYRQTWMRGSRLLAWAIWGIAELNAAQLVVSVSPTVELARMAFYLRWVGLAFSPILLFMFAVRHTRRAKPFLPAQVIALNLVPILSQVVIWFFPQWFFEDVQFLRPVLITVYQVTFTGWFSVSALYSYTLAIIGFGLVAYFILWIDSSRRLGGFWVLVAILVGALPAALSWQMGPSPGYSLTPFGLGLMAVGVCWVLFRQQFLYLMPVAFDAVFASIYDAILVLTPDGRILHANPSAVQLFEQANYRNQPLTSLIPNFQLLCFQGVATAKTCELAHQTRSFAVIITPLLQYNYHVGFVVTLRDVTDEKRTQAQALHMALEQERQNILQMFIQSAAHEFRTPLTDIKTSAYLAQRSQDEDKRNGYFERINHQVDRINALVNDMVLITRLDTLPQVPQDKVNLSLICEQLVYSFGTRAHEQGVYLSYEAASAAVYVRGNMQELQTALYKLLDNALRYTPPAGHVRVRLSQTGDSVTLVIADTGVGMDEETQARATERFFRNDDMHTTVGVGLGLPIAKQVIATHGGTLTLDTQPERGTTAMVQLPVL